MIWVFILKNEILGLYLRNETLFPNDHVKHNSRSLTAHTEHEDPQRLTAVDGKGHLTCK